MRIPIFLILVFLANALFGRSRPNVVLILTDDQGFGELGATGNPVVRTPRLDRLARESASLTSFHVFPVCSPTRASLMTGRHFYRTGLTDTYLGRSLMDPGETTLAEAFSKAGYITGIFGKWHLGDNYPMRAMDQGFQETLVLNGGGLAQPGDPPVLVEKSGAYFNPTLSKNGEWVKTDGYVSDVITTGAIDFIADHRDDPFFVYLPFNCPHTPLQVPDEYREHYGAADFDPAKFPSHDRPMAAKQNGDRLARVYGMIENIDDNVGRLLAKLDELKLADDTLVIFFSDNGCQQHGGYNAGLHGWKGSVHEGGIRQFCFLRWPGKLKANLKFNEPTAVYDLFPTLLELCGLPASEDQLDGVSLAPILLGKETSFPERPLVMQWHRGTRPERYRSFAVRKGDWKLVQAGGNWEPEKGEPNFQLFHIPDDPLELDDLADKQPGRVAELKADYDAWFDDISSDRNFDNPPRIIIDPAHENPVLLTRQDWRGPQASWNPDGKGHWELFLPKETKVDVTLRFTPVKSDGIASLDWGSGRARAEVATGSTECQLKGLVLPAGPINLAPTIKGESERGATYLEFQVVD